MVLIRKNCSYYNEVNDVIETCRNNFNAIGEEFTIDNYDIVLNTLTIIHNGKEHSYIAYEVIIHK